MNPIDEQHPSGNSPGLTRAVLIAACLLIVALYASMANLKGIGTDEGFRLGIINGGHEFTADESGTRATWGDVLKTNAPYAYQPLYFLIQNTVMRVGHTRAEAVLKGVNIFFLWLSLQGLLALSRGWPPVPRLFLLGLFSLNAYLFMHVLQLREYIAGITFYVWSSWLVLRLDRRSLGGGWVDVAWFAAYGLLLGLGFFTQSWTVFPAIAQGLFLVARRTGDRLRFYAHLAVSYVIVLSVALPYLLTHRQKADIGLWGTPGTFLWPRLADGFHLVLSGHSFGESLPADSLFWFWLILLALGGVLLGRRKSTMLPAAVAREYRRQALLMGLCLAVSVAFQIGYFLKVDTLSVWPRYFALHYFFVTWLVVLAFKSLYDLATSRTLRIPARRWLKVSVAVVITVTIFSGIFQTWSYYRNPYWDTGLSGENNWRVLSADLARIIRPGDVVLTQDFIHAWTLTFTRPMTNRVMLLPELESNDLNAINRLVYLEPGRLLVDRDILIFRMTTSGFNGMEVIPTYASDGKNILPDWQILVFKRH